MEDMDKEVGARIKQRRMDKNLTLKDLGEKTNLSVSYLSLIERGKASINLTILYSIAKALDTPPSFFIQEGDNGCTHIIHSYEQRVCQVGTRHIYYELSGKIDREDTVFQPLLVVLLPGESRENFDTYAHEGEEFGYVLEGRLSFFVDGVEYELYPGDSLHISSTHMHNWANFTNNNVKLIYVTTPIVHFK